jgi:YegS/Rv2252/BmrU family lipid kinase
MEKISFILHGKMRGRRSVKDSLMRKFSENYVVQFYETAHPRHAEELAIKALNDDCDFMISVGGDGTLHEVVNGFLKSGGRKKFKTVLGVLPYGTGNDFARGLGVTRNIDQLSEMISLNRPAILDAGCMEFQQPDGSVKICYFDNIADLGIGADVVVQVNGVHLRKKILGGTLTFFLSVMITFLTFKPKKVRVSWEGFTWEGSVLSLVVANGRFFGSGLGVAPDAKQDDGLFEVVIFADLSVLDYLKNFARVRKCLRVMHPEAHYYRAKEILVEPIGNIAIVESDGEIAGQAPVLYKCLPAAMPFLIP